VQAQKKDSFLAAYVGPSMNPILRAPALVEVIPYGVKERPAEPQGGDVILFTPPGHAEPWVHRVVRVTVEGVETQGDNNPREDEFILGPEHIEGRVVAVWQGDKRRPVSGGVRGRARSRWIRWARRPGRAISVALRPAYHALSRSGVVAGLLPRWLRPLVAATPSGEGERPVLLWGGRVVGRYQPDTGRWWIRRPFRLLVDESRLPAVSGDAHLFELEDGTRWAISAADVGARAAVERLADAMGLAPAAIGGRGETHVLEDRSLTVKTDRGAGQGRLVPRSQDSRTECEDSAVLTLPLAEHRAGRYVQLVELSSCLARDAQSRGGVLLHGALAEKEGRGVILAAPGGTGKSTASERLPGSWRSLSDDAALVVRGARGGYCAHPWPTWSRFFAGDPAETWPVREAVSLEAIFFLSQASADRTQSLGPGHAVTMLVESAEQASLPMTRGMTAKEARAVRLQRFDNLCALAQAVPAHVLHLSLEGSFWQEIERVIGLDG